MLPLVRLLEKNIVKKTITTNSSIHINPTINRITRGSLQI